MKNYILKIPQALFLLGAMVVFSSCMNNKAAETEKTAVLKDNRNVERKTDRNDTRFLAEAAEMHHEEISLGKLAQRKSNAAHVRDHGKMMETDHAKSLDELTTLARSKNISIPNPPADSDLDDYRSLNEMDSTDFGKDYSDMMVKKHQHGIELFEDAIDESEDMEIKAWATKTHAMLKTHLTHSLECQKECAKS